MKFDLQSVDYILTTTRSVRKRLDFDRPVAPELIEECIEIAIQAPTGSNAQGWHWMVITDPQKRKAIADVYRTGFEGYATRPRPEYPVDDARHDAMPRVVDSATYLAENMHRAPVFVIPCIEGRVETAGPAAQASIYGSLLPAAWSFMLAARARGLGSAWTTIHLFNEKAVADLLQLPPHITQGALLPVAYFSGEDFRVAPRVPARERTYWDTWDRKR
ncbi:MAG: nitroreductase family protein [Dehalococcoidia bacterium]